jgi:hypothetical protein
MLASVQFALIPALWTVSGHRCQDGQIRTRGLVPPATPTHGRKKVGVPRSGGSVGQLAPGGRLVAGDLAAVLFVGQGVVQPWRWFAARRISELHRVIGCRSSPQLSRTSRSLRANASGWPA